ncbi:MAG: 2,3-bisphosphoglycerate-independent phosphoglycerate mutase [Alphaproteobacteria bacterium]|nr:2,3-bisphosphoglycerate-independent phosphoglycerate mutase [Alphaproteobacteria bacterium]
MIHASSRPKPVILAILDGWGHSDAPEHNAIAAAHTPTWDRLRAHYPYGTLNASEGFVGLPEGQMGNSEVGHMNIGAGRIVMQDLPRIDAAIADGSLAADPVLQRYIAALKTSGGTCHLLGLVSDGGVHAHQHHIASLATIIASHGVPVAIHAFTDGRDTPPQSAQGYIASLTHACAHPSIRIATVIGRYYAMDRDKRWERVSAAYDAMVNATGTVFASARDAIDASYSAGTNDEFILPCIIDGYHGMQDGDGLLMANFRADRARQMLHALLDEQFSGFTPSRRVSFAATLGMVEYSEALNPLIPAVFAPQSLTDILGEVVSRAGLTQLRIAETEKYAHVTFFFNGGREEPFAGEERILIPSPKVATYDLLPEMSAAEVTDAIVDAIANERFDVTIVNYANTDMVGHSGSLEAAAKAVEAVDACLGRLTAAVDAKGGAMIITADHGNAESMHDHDSGQPHTAHTLNLVPFILYGPRFAGHTPVLGEGKLADIAPSMLALLGLAKPDSMTGESLIPPMFATQHAVA